MSWKDNIKNLNSTLNQPKETVPNLTNDDIELLLMETILAYIDNKIDLKTLIELAKAIKKYSVTIFSKKTDDSIQTILELKNYSNNIQEILTDVLQDLVKN